MPDPTDQATGAPDAGGAPEAPPPSPPGMPTGGAPGPSGAPMLGPNKMAGKAASAKIKVQVAIHALMLAAQETGVMSEEGRAILDAIQKLTKQFGKSEDQSKQLMPAELAQILQQSKPGAMNPALAGAVRPQAPPPMAA
jgi:hypothetical protein